jgi:hypothetical protein
MELTRAKFSASRGWSLITRLVSRILIEVAAPRNGVKQNFVTGRNDIIAQQIFWAVIRSHDIMARYKDKSFKNDPSVSAEYVKFLIMNTGMDIVDSSHLPLRRRVLVGLDSGVCISLLEMGTVSGTRFRRIPSLVAWEFASLQTSFTNSFDRQTKINICQVTNYH